MDVIDVLEAAYAASADEGAWLEGVSAAVRPLLDEGHGMIAGLYDAREPDWVTMDRLVARGADEAFVGSLFNVPVQRGVESRSIVELYRRVTVATLESGPSIVSPAVYGYFRRVLDAAGLGDIRFVNAIDPGYCGCVMVAPSSRCRAWPPRLAHSWSFVAAHIAAGLRVKRRLRLWANHLDPASEAVLRPDGRVEHATGGARATGAQRTLREGVLAIDRARGPLRRRNEDRSLAVWRGLVAGKWSLLDHFDSDGKRFIVALRNEPHLPDLRGLTARERQVAGYVALGHSNKFIAYSLGLSTSTVATYVLRAKRKLSLFQALAAAPDGQAR